jgi:hypothetical protein
VVQQHVAQRRRVRQQARDNTSRQCREGRVGGRQNSQRRRLNRADEAGGLDCRDECREAAGGRGEFRISNRKQKSKKKKKKSGFALTRRPPGC